MSDKTFRRSVIIAIAFTAYYGDLKFFATYFLLFLTMLIYCAIASDKALKQNKHDDLADQLGTISASSIGIGIVLFSIKVLVTGTIR